MNCLCRFNMACPAHPKEEKGAVLQAVSVQGVSQEVRDARVEGTERAEEKEAQPKGQETLPGELLPGPPPGTEENPEEDEDPLVTVLISPSELGYMFECHRKHHYAYDLRYTAIDKNQGMEKGTVIHEGMKGYYREKMRQIATIPERDKRDFEAMKKAGKLAMGPAISQVSLDGKDLAFLEDTYDQYVQFNRGEGIDPIAAEQWFNKELFVHNGIRYCIYGKIDLIGRNRENRKITIIDHKSSGQKQEPSEMDIQYKTYCLGTGLRHVMWNFIGLQKSYKPSERFIRRSWEYTEIQMEEFKQEIIFKLLEHVRNVTLGHYPHNPTACIIMYRKCYFYDVCKGDPRVRQRRLDNFFIKRGLDKNLDKLRDEYEAFQRQHAKDQDTPA